MADDLRSRLQQRAQEQPQGSLRDRIQTRIAPGPGPGSASTDVRGGPLQRNPVVQEGAAVARQFGQGALELLNLPQQGVDAALGLLGVNLPRGPRLFEFREPETRAQAAANLAGEAAVGAAIPTAMGLQSIRQGTQATTAAGGFLQQLGRSTAQRPAATATAELASGAGAGAAGFEVERLFPDSPAAKAFAEIAGGVAGGLAPAAISSGAQLATGTASAATTGIPFLGPLIRRSAQSLREFLTPQGAFQRAASRVERASSDPEEALRRAEEAPVLEEAPLTLAQRSGDPGLLALERSVMAANERVSRRHREQFTEVNQAIRQSMEQTLASPRRVDPESAREFLTGLLDARIRQAQVIADERLQALAPTATRENANELAAEELRRVLNVAIRQESELWEAIPSDLPVLTDSSRGAFEQIRGKLSQAERDNMPAIAKELLDADSDSFLGPVTTFKEIRGLRSELRGQARRDRANSSFGSARIADELADALAEDLTRAGQQSAEGKSRDLIQIATDFSRDRNDRFTRGEVGRLLGTNRDGGARTPSGLALESTVGTGGPRARVATDALLEAVRRSGDEEVMRGHIENFLKEDFNRFAIKSDRTIDTRSAGRFIEANKDVLARFPELKRSMEQAQASGEIVQTLESVTNPRVTRAAVFLNAPPGREMERVLNSREPRQAIKEILELAGKDPDGIAIGGLRTAFLNRLLDRSVVAGRATDDAGDVFVSGRNLFREINNPASRQVAEQLYSPEQREKLTIIANTARRLELARESPEAMEGVLNDAPGAVLGLVSRLGGAQFGNFVARNFGGATIQTPAIFSAAFRNAARRGVNDPGSALLTEAFEPGNDDLFRSLIVDASGSPQREDFIRTRVNAWLVSVGADPLTREEVQEEAQRLQAEGQQQ